MRYLKFLYLSNFLAFTPNRESRKNRNIIMLHLTIHPSSSTTINQCFFMGQGTSDPTVRLKYR